MSHPRLIIVLTAASLLTALTATSEAQLRRRAARRAQPPAAAPQTPAKSTEARPGTAPPTRPTEAPLVAPTPTVKKPVAAKPAAPKSMESRLVEKQPESVADYECRFIEDEIVLDGRADEASWKVAQPVGDFRMPWVRGGDTKPRTATRAKLLWDREYLYFFAEMDDTDLYADVTQHDGVTWNNDVFELFFKPADDKPGYYEFQVNAANTTMDMFLPRRNAGGFERFKGDGEFDFKSAVDTKGTLNKWNDKDTGWSVEGRLAWRDFARTGGRPNAGERWKFTLCRYDYSIDFEGPALSVSAPMKTKPGPDFHFFEDYAPIKFIGPNESPKSQAAKRYGLEHLAKLTSSRVIGSPEPPHPYTTERIFEKLPIKFPVSIRKQPGSDLVWVVTQPWPYQPVTLSRFKNDPAVAELETIIPADADSVIYDICFHPQFAKNGYVYLGSNGSYGGPKRSRITRYHIDPSEPTKFDVASATVIIEWESDGHNGAAMAFGPDGMLYVTSGDGTGDSDQNLRGQDLTHLTSKLLRIDVDHAEPGKTYRVPADNPFFGQPNVRPETYAFGLRNPWRIAIDDKTSQIWIGNNGQDLWEQIYLIEAGANYGWSVMEGGHEFYPQRIRGSQEISLPVAEHAHSEARSLTGGLIYRGDKLPDLNGAYLYADYSTGKIWGIRHDGKQKTWHQEIADTTLQVTAFAEGNDGDIWMLDHGGHAIHRLVPAPKDLPPSNFPTRLSESGLFKNVAAHEMADGVLPYSINSPLWSDGAHKERWLAIPNAGGDRVIDYTGSNGWNFPNETVLVKSFALETTAGDPKSRRWIETRFLTRQQNEWVGYSYEWNADGTDATLIESAGKDRDFEIRDPSAADGIRQQKWHYPSRTECMVCHSRAANYVLGLQTAQMNRDHQYGDVVDNQLRVLEHLQLLRVNWGGENHQSNRSEFVEKARKEAGANAFDAAVEKDINRRADEYIGLRLGTRDQRATPPNCQMLAKPPAALAKLADPYDSAQALAARARSYLHANCAQCHVGAGGGNARIDLHIDTPLAKMNVLDEGPAHHTFGMPDARIVAQGAPDRSVLLTRLSMRGPGQMPQLATSVIDQQAVALMHAWIASLGQESTAAK